jgi:actin-related protein
MIPHRASGHANADVVCVNANIIITNEASREPIHPRSLVRFIERYLDVPLD